jgi:hypothetical protein
MRVRYERNDLVGQSSYRAMGARIGNNVVNGEATFIRAKFRPALANWIAVRRNGDMEGSAMEGREMSRREGWPELAGLAVVLALCLIEFFLAVIGALFLIRGGK